MQHFAGQYYHIYNRGVLQQPIFANPGNYIYLLQKIKQFLPQYPLSMIAYYLMPNHYHFILLSKEEGAIAPFIQRLFTSYSQALNRQQNRKGTLFENRPKSKLVDQDSYVLQLVRYIHLNPVRAGLASQPGEWPYSNYLEWIGQRNGTLCDREFIELFFKNPGEYKDFVVTTLSTETENNLTEYYLD